MADAGAVFSDVLDRGRSVEAPVCLYCTPLSPFWCAWLLVVLRPHPHPPPPWLLSFFLIGFGFAAAAAAASSAGCFLVAVARRPRFGGGDADAKGASASPSSAAALGMIQNLVPTGGIGGKSSPWSSPAARAANSSRIRIFAAAAFLASANGPSGFAAAAAPAAVNNPNTQN